MRESLLVDLYELTMAQSYFLYRRTASATFDLFVRELPANRSYLVAAGLQEIAEYVTRLRFDADDLRYLRGLGLFSRDFLEYLRHFRFSGDLWAMSEGEIFFAGEPLIRVTAPVIEAQIMESFLLNTVNLQTMIASKASRVVSAARGRPAYDFSLRRTHGSDAANKVARSAYLAGFAGTSNVLAGKLYGIPVAGTMAHSFVMSFKSELESFLAYSNVFADRTILLVDTYDVHKGIANAIAIGHYLREQGHSLVGIRLDSGNIVQLSRYARDRLDKAGLSSVRIFASGDLDEFKIHALLRKGACVDSFGVGTNMGTSSDAPSLDVIYKISEITDEEGNFLPTMKLSKGKATYPGRKQVFRLERPGKGYCGDVIGLETERIGGRPLLRRIFKDGRRTAGIFSLQEARRYCNRQLARFPEGLRDVEGRYRYFVSISPRLKELRRRLARQLKARQ